MTLGRRAIVVGAGIGGLSAAISLRAGGLAPAVFERAGAPHAIGAGILLWVNAMRALRKLGLADDVQARGAVISSMEWRTWRGKVLKALPVGRLNETLGAPTVGIHRAELHGVLARALPAGTIRPGVALTGYAQDTGGVTALFSGGSQERGDVLIGADGIDSTVRKQLLGQASPRFAGYTCWRSTVELDHPLLRPDTYAQLFGPAGSGFGICPISANRWAWWAHRVRPPAHGPEGGSAKDGLLDYFGRWYEPVRAVLDAADTGRIVRQEVHDLDGIDTWSAGRVTLLGDAAHAMLPALGQGGCMAIEDAWELGRELGSGRDVPEALQRYQDARRQRVNATAREARRLSALHHSPNPLLRLIRLPFLRFAPTRVVMRNLETLLDWERP